jgi:hypothetical protein
VSKVAVLPRWRRFGKGLAHAFVGARVLCRTRFLYELRTSGTIETLEVGPSGLPYGSVCRRCAKLIRSETCEVHPS